MEERKNNNRFAGRKAAVIASLLAVALSATALLALQQQSALAQNSNSSSTVMSPPATRAIPQLNGSISIKNATNDFVRNNVKVSFTDAANTAGSQVTNGVVIGGRLSEVQGYLTYTFKVANYNAGTMKIVIVDVGNGKVLYTSNDVPLINGGVGGGCPGWRHMGPGWHNGFGPGPGRSIGPAPSGSIY
jgi:uncharacterized membrane protein YkoI